MEVTLPVIRPSLMIISDHGKDTVDFGDVVNGNVSVLRKYLYTYHVVLYIQVSH